MSLWNSDTGNLIQHSTLPNQITAGEGIASFLHQFKIEGNHLVLLVAENEHRCLRRPSILIYELDQVMAGENARPRVIPISVERRFNRLLVDKTSITVASEFGIVVKLDFWGSG